MILAGLMSSHIRAILFGYFKKEIAGSAEIKICPFFIFL